MFRMEAFVQQYKAAHLTYSGHGVTVYHQCFDKQTKSFQIELNFKFSGYKDSEISFNIDAPL